MWRRLSALLHLISPFRSECSLRSRWRCRAAAMYLLKFIFYSVWYYTIPNSQHQTTMTTANAECNLGGGWKWNGVNWLEQDSKRTWQSQRKLNSTTSRCLWLRQEKRRSWAENFCRGGGGKCKWELHNRFSCDFSFCLLSFEQDMPWYSQAILRYSVLSGKIWGEKGKFNMKIIQIRLSLFPIVLYVSDSSYSLLFALARPIMRCLLLVMASKLLGVGKWWSFVKHENSMLLFSRGLLFLLFKTVSTMAIWGGIKRVRWGCPRKIKTTMTQLRLVNENEKGNLNEMKWENERKLCCCFSCAWGVLNTIE